MNEERGLLVTTEGGLVAQYIEVYDVATDCAHPKFLGRYDAKIPIFHGLKVSDDGNTVYATDTFGFTGVGQVMHVIDISDPTNPTLIRRWDPTKEPGGIQYAIHDLDISPDGNRLYTGDAAYQAVIGVIVGGGPSVGETPSLSILDTSEVQARVPDPEIPVISTMSLPNFGHTVQQMRIDGKPYLLVSGEAPVDGAQCPWAWGHIIDVSDETKPQRVSDLRLEVNQAKNCPKTILDKGAIYSIHYVGVDSEEDTRYVFYTYYSGGMRVFDVRDPGHPKEVGYFHSAATPNTKFPALTQGTPDGNPQTTDLTTSVVRYRPQTGEIWVISVNSGFQVLRLTGQLAEQRAKLRVHRVGAGAAAARGRIPVEASCAQPCRIKIRLEIDGRAGPARVLALPVRGKRTVRVRLSRGQRTRSPDRRPRGTRGRRRPRPAHRRAPAQHALEAADAARLDLGFRRMDGTRAPRIAPGRPAQTGRVNALIARGLGWAAGSGPPNLFTTLGRHRSLFRPWLRFAGALMPGGRLPRVDSEIVILARRPQLRLRVRVATPRAARRRGRALERRDRPGPRGPRRRAAGARARRCCCGPSTSSTASAGSATRSGLNWRLSSTISG